MKKPTISPSASSARSYVRHENPDGMRAAFSFLELQVAFVVFGIALAGLCPLVMMQSKQLAKIDGWLSPQTTYYLVPSSDAWARKLGAVAMIQTLDPGPAPPPPVLIIDNGQTGYSETGTGWTDETPANAFQGTDRWHAPGDGSNTATWQFTNLTPGWYSVQVTWPEGSDRANNATYTVYDGTKQLGSFTVNQQIAPAGTVYQGRPWQSLMILPISSTTAQVMLSDQASGKVIADGVWLLPIFNDVQILSLERALTSEDVTVHVAVTVQVPR